jgi:glycine cleavage system transcriptional repressor
MAELDPQKHYVLVTTLGTDRPGIVQDISLWILEHGGNIEDSRMSLLGGEFATLILVSGSPDISSELEHSRQELESSASLTVFTRTVEPRAAAQDRPSLRYHLEATALDHTGIVHHATRILREQSINIVTASTRISRAPFTGAPVFQMEMEIDIPAEVSVKRLRGTLEELGERQNIDFVLSPAT